MQQATIVRTFRAERAPSATHLTLAIGIRTLPLLSARSTAMFRPVHTTYPNSPRSDDPTTILGGGFDLFFTERGILHYGRAQCRYAVQTVLLAGGLLDRFSGMDSASQDPRSLRTGVIIGRGAICKKRKPLSGDSGERRFPFLHAPQLRGATHPSLAKSPHRPGVCPRSSAAVASKRYGSGVLRGCGASSEQVTQSPVAPCSPCTLAHRKRPPSPFPRVLAVLVKDSFIQPAMRGPGPSGRLVQIEKSPPYNAGVGFFDIKVVRSPILWGRSSDPPLDQPSTAVAALPESSSPFTSPFLQSVLNIEPATRGLPTSSNINAILCKLAYVTALYHSPTTDAKFKRGGSSRPAYIIALCVPRSPSGEFPPSPGLFVHAFKSSALRTPRHIVQFAHRPSSAKSNQGNPPS